MAKAIAAVPRARRLSRSMEGTESAVVGSETAWHLDAVNAATTGVIIAG